MRRTSEDPYKRQTTTYSDESNAKSPTGMPESSITERNTNNRYHGRNEVRILLSFYDASYGMMLIYERRLYEEHCTTPRSYFGHTSHRVASHIIDRIPPKTSHSPDAIHCSSSSWPPPTPPHHFSMTQPSFVPANPRAHGHYGSVSRHVVGTSAVALPDWTIC